MIPEEGSGDEAGLGAVQLQFLSEALSGTAYDMALVFLHHPLWLADEPVQYANRDYNVADRALPDRFWSTRVLPLLEQGRVGGVFAGDGGVVHPSIVTQLCGVPHYLSGWDLDLQRRPAEFLRILADEQDRLHVLRYVMFDNQLFRTPFKQVTIPGPPACKSG